MKTWNAVSDLDVSRLIKIVGADNVSRRGSDLKAHSVDESWVDPHQAEVIVWPTSTADVVQIVGLASERSLPLVPWGGGSSLEGNPIPIHGGILLGMYRMDKVLDINEADLQVTVQPGVIYDALNAQLLRLGMFFPPAPGSSDVATLGGMVANNSSGMRTVKYGVTRDYVQRLEVVLPDGRLVHVGSNAKKSTSGYDLVSLFVGSEGTLGIVTEITLRVIGAPEHVAAVVAVFDDIDAATGTVYDCIRLGLDPSAVEFLDEGTVHVTNSQQDLSLDEAPTLFVEFHGTASEVEEQVDYFRELCDDAGCTGFQAAMTASTREELWAARSEVHDSIKFSHPGAVMMAGDVCVPISRFGDMVRFVHDLAERVSLPIYAFGHAGDGNLHTETIAHREDADEFARGVQATDAIIRHGLDLGGTVAGEHGVGVAKREYMALEHTDSLPLMRSLKDLIDPKGIMNPGKILMP